MVAAWHRRVKAGSDPLLKSTRARSLAPLPRTVLMLCLVSFFNDVASDMVVPLLPLLLAGPIGGGAIARPVEDPRWRAPMAT